MEDQELERVTSTALQQISESRLALQQPERQLSEAQIVQVGELMANMMAGYPHQALEMAAEVYQMAFEDLAKLYGIEQLETVLRLFLTHQKFFPHPSEVREALDEMKRKAEAEAKANLPKIGCDKCVQVDESGIPDGLPGFVYVDKPGGPRVVTDCECRIRRAQAKRALEAKRGSHD